MSEAKSDVQEQPIVRCDLRENGGLVEFFAANEIMEWATSESNFWKWTTNSGIGSLRKQFENRQAEVLNQLVEFVRHFASAEQSSQAGVAKQIESHLRECFDPIDRPRMLHSESEMAARIEKIRAEEGDRIAAQALAYHIQVTPLPNQPTDEWLPGAFREVAFERGIVSHMDEKEKLEKLRNEFQSALDECKHTAKKDQEHSSKQLQEARTTLDALDLHYREKIKFKEAVTYWDQKKTDHANAAKRWGWMSMAVLAIGLVVVSIFWYCSTTPTEVLKEAESVVTESTGSVVLATVLYSSIRFALFMLGIIWLGRIVVRNYLSNTHLASDAAERAVVIQTYLSLIADPEVVENKEHHDKMLEAALKRIFWHAQTGIVKDDALPSAMFSMVNKPSG